MAFFTDPHCFWIQTLDSEHRKL